MKMVRFVAMFVFFILTINPAHARHRHASPKAPQQPCFLFCDNKTAKPFSFGTPFVAPSVPVQRFKHRQRAYTPHIERPHRYAHVGGRPRAWCGWWMRQQLGVSDTAGNQARWWAHYGSNAGGPAVGVIVVWAHHVGRITGMLGSQWVVQSGNDGHAVRERARSLSRVIAYRQP